MERADLLALLYLMFSCVFVTIWCPGSAVVFDCMDPWPRCYKTVNMLN